MKPRWADQEPDSADDFDPKTTPTKATHRARSSAAHLTLGTIRSSTRLQVPKALQSSSPAQRSTSSSSSWLQGSQKKRWADSQSEDEDEVQVNINGEQIIQQSETFEKDDKGVAASQPEDVDPELAAWLKKGASASEPNDAPQMSRTELAAWTNKVIGLSRFASVDEIADRPLCGSFWFGDSSLAHSSMVGDCTNIHHIATTVAWSCHGHQIAASLDEMRCRDDTSPTSNTSVQDHTLSAIPSFWESVQKSSTPSAEHSNSFGRHHVEQIYAGVASESDGQ